MSNNYQYPIDLDWTSEEMAIVVKMWNGLEQAYESSINREELLSRYKAFKQVVPSKMEEKQLGNSFEKMATNFMARSKKREIQKQKLFQCPKGQMVKCCR